MAQPWRDIDNPGVWRKPEPETPTKPATGFDDSPPAPREPLAKEYRFKDVSIVEPAQGFEKNKPFDMEGEIEPFDKSKPISASKILLYPIGVYNGQEDKFAPGGIEADLDQKTGKFRATCKSLFDPQPFTNDTNKPADTTWKLYVRAEGGAAEKPMESDQLTFPKESQFVELKKGDYDEDGAKTYGKPESGENFKSNGVVKSLQGDLIKTLFLPKGSGDGFFGDQTDKAVREFQGYAIKAERMKRSAGKTEKTNQTLDVPQPDGIVEKKTRDEIDRWLQSDWVKPIPTLRHGEYDDTGVSNGKGKRGTDDHHEGTPVVDAQKDLQKVGVYSDAAVDGWFFDKMLDAVKLFQETAVKGEFIINGVITDIGEKLTGHSKGELCLKTQEYLKKVVEKEGKVQGPEKPKWIEIAEKELGQKEIKGDKDNPRIIEYHSSTTGKAQHDEVAWCSAFVNWVMQKAGYDGTKSAMAISWKNWGEKIQKPIYGCITIIDYSYKGEKFKNSGHVAFAVGKDSKHITLLGGNQSDSVKYSHYKLSDVEKYLTYVSPVDYAGKGQDLKPFKGSADEGNFTATR